MFYVFYAPPLPASTYPSHMELACCLPRYNPTRKESSRGIGPFALRRLDLSGVLPRASRALGARAAAETTPFPECAIDVNNLNNLAIMATQILTVREKYP